MNPEAGKIFPRFPCFQICPNAKDENSEISEISLTLLFCSETQLQITFRYKSQIIPEAEKNVSEISNLP